MRVPPPGLLKLDRESLLRDVRERLADRLPHYRNSEEDPTDPGWLLLEQSAWLVEILSEQLDQYPFAVVQHFIHMMGGQLRPAQPSIGVVLAQVGTEGTMKLDAKRPAPWRFFTAQTETLDSIEFAPLEPEVDLYHGGYVSVARMSEGELFRASSGPAGEGIEGQQLWVGDAERSGIFEREQIEYVAVTNNAKALMESLEKALEALADRNIGWLRLEASQVSRERVLLRAEIAPAGAFARTAPGGIAPGGDLEGDWGTLDGSTWTPPVRISNDSLLPPHIHGQQPLPGHEEGQIVLMDVPENFPVDRILQRKASPMPTSVIEAVWRTLTNIDVKLAPLKPSVRTLFKPVEEDEEPAWVAGAIESGIWAALAPGKAKTLFHLNVQTARKKPGNVRAALVFDTAEVNDLPRIQAFAMSAEGALFRKPLDVRVVWRMPAPPREGGQIMPLIVGLDIPFQSSYAGLLIVAEGDPTGAMFNAFLVTNMPVVRDGRTTTVQRNVPVDVNLLYEDVITPSVVQQLLEEPLPADVRRLLRDFPLSYFSTSAREGAVVDWHGVKVDPSEGTVTLNSPDADGRHRSFRPGTQVKLDWYRYTNGGHGDSPPDSIRLVEHPPSSVPSIMSVTNPLGTFFGAHRESPEAAVDRLFAPAGGTPVLPSDFERLVRQTLGSRGEGWLVRCWSYAERALVSSALWPLGELVESPDPETLRLQERLSEAGPDVLLVVLGPKEGRLSDQDLDWAERAIRRMVKRVSERLPTVRDAVVTRIWPLKLRVDEVPEDLVTPSFDVRTMRGMLVDERGHEAAPPQSCLLLNAAVTEVQGRSAAVDEADV